MIKSLTAMLTALSMIVSSTAFAKSCEQEDQEYLLRSLQVDNWECRIFENGLLGCARYDGGHNTTLAFLLPLAEIGKVKVTDFSVTFECEIGACFKRIAYTGKNPKNLYLNEWAPSAWFQTTALSDLIKREMVRCFANAGLGEDE